ncbi:protease inhibitor I42 family protein [Armatimonas sp.]|uniref:protease inhibitor I42 family protein n=1 Tax=Armatimonas sp. TaxID=1872638 RepID=UPI00286B47C6|nr:protease inhibitor I42 family protein [Armatimonas sp.]
MQKKPQRIFTAKDSGKEVTLKVGETFGIQLETNPSTGYGWYFVVSENPFLPISTTSLNDASKTPRPPGAPTTQLSIFKADKVGERSIAMIYIRLFELKAAPTKTFQLRVVVKK